ncbi:hypothetical protein QOZ88_12095 [Blastococcus sp. BMG 814]|uniref:Uncharacterized protein n=1 Tax=Blastococcus carthaginiensis TaxID=3050034 RepID=A0ABT9ICT9_9ACTN|nr:hypothetical protein [Blastococcus carthaginiensis]MDP5183382.1 hypothetical protein [Blastococcus carthaginiensis]
MEPDSAGSASRRDAVVTGLLSTATADEQQFFVRLPRPAVLAAGV